ncbi:hypothetical protein GNF76_03725 [Pseudomonas sp. CCM 7893]|uniref:Uncharacterized protein n=1 Tax=Pseudomonas spelaei TaxID=1055469 RepID=A0A6I3W7Y2_9PSED|nr:hypothetical protein [Pseudomonas spelaei]MUF03429.1 hypothetical protein [Pseudomonas spelaei]
MSVNLNHQMFQAFTPDIKDPSSHQDPAQYEQLWQKYGKDQEPLSADEQKLLNSPRFNRRTREADAPDETALKDKMGRNELRQQLGVSSRKYPDLPGHASTVSYDLLHRIEHDRPDLLPTIHHFLKDLHESTVHPDNGALPSHINARLPGKAPSSLRSFG